MFHPFLPSFPLFAATFLINCFLTEIQGRTCRVGHAQVRTSELRGQFLEAFRFKGVHIQIGQVC